MHVSATYLLISTIATCFAYLLKSNISYVLATYLLKSTISNMFWLLIY